MVNVQDLLHYLVLRRLKSSLTVSYFLRSVPYIILIDSLGPPW